MQISPARKPTYGRARIAVFGLLMIALWSAAGQSIYRCDTPDGPVFSDRPCGDSAETLELKVRSPRQSAGERRSAAAAPAVVANDASPVDASRVREAFFRTPAEVREILGPPAAAYRSSVAEHWFYPNIVRQSPALESPEIRFEDGRFFEVDWLSQPHMTQAVALARGLAGATPNPDPRPKSFAIDRLELRGLERDAVRDLLGEPDDWRIDEGAEAWLYHRVAISAGGPPDASLRILFGERGVLTIGTVR